MKRSFNFCAMVGALSIATPAAANLIGNGSFEDGVSLGLGSSQQLQPGDTSLSGCTVGGPRSRGIRAVTISIRSH
jgi:hypothetical protein